MGIDQRILARLNELLELGAKVLATRRKPPPRVITDDYVDTQLAIQWFTSSQNLLVRVFGADSEFYKNFTKHAEKRPSFSPVYCAYGALLAAKEDYEHEGLINVRALIEAELFDEFLEQAEHLLVAGYHQPAAVVAGAVLEDGLRKLCVQKSLALGGSPKLDRMNAELAKSGTYNKLTQKRITALADLRNSAAHGKWDEFSADDVADMIGSIRKIMEEHFS